MTGYQSKRAMAQDKLEQWDTPSEAFNAWWNNDYDDNTNPFTKDTFGYWAWAGWQAALAQPAQEPWRESASDYERGFIDGRQKQAQSSVDKAVNRMAQRPWVGLTDEERVSFEAANPKTQKEWDELFNGIEAKFKQKNNG